MGDGSPSQDQLRSQIKRLRSQVGDLQDLVRGHTDNACRSSRPSLQQMPAEPAPNNPYSGVVASAVPEPARLRGCSVALFSCGGVGCSVAEMLARCGVGRLLLFDTNSISMSDMSR